MEEPFGINAIDANASELLDNKLNYKATNLLKPMTKRETNLRLQ
jgi:hypothetical protein